MMSPVVPRCRCCETGRRGIDVQLSQLGATDAHLDHVDVYAGDFA